MSNHALNDLLQQPGIWRAGDPAVRTGLEYVNTGYRVLDQALPGHGWPLGALTEILHDHAGIGELRLLMPALARLSRSGRWIVLVAPPHIPYAPALAASGIDLSRLLLVHPRETGEHDHLWAIEQALRAGTCAAVLAWPGQIDGRQLRRLQLAAETGRCWGVLFRDAAAVNPSPAPLRLQLEPADNDAVRIRLLKCRGAASGTELTLPLNLLQGSVTKPLFHDSESSPHSEQRPRRTAATTPRRPQLELALASGATGTEPREHPPLHGPRH